MPISFQPLLKKLFLLLAVSFLFLECRKSDKIESISSTETVKEWYYAKFRKSTEYKDARSSVGFRLPDWEKAISYRIGNLNFVEIPLLQERKQRTLYNEQLPIIERNRIFNVVIDKILFIQFPNGKIDVKIVQFTPTLNYLQQKSYDISDNNLHKIDPTYSGAIKVFKWNGQLVKGLLLDNGKIQKRIINATRQKPTVLGRSSDWGSTVCDYHVTYHYTQNCTYTVYGDGMETNECDDPVLDYIEYEE